MKVRLPTFIGFNGVSPAAACNTNCNGDAGVRKLARHEHGVAAEARRVVARATSR